MKLQVKSAGGELTVQSQKEFLKLFQRGFIAQDDLVLRGDRWVPAGELPWIRGMAVDRKRDNKQLFWITLGMMLVGLAGVVWIQKHARTVVRHTVPAVVESQPPPPPGAVHAVPAR